MSPTTPHASTRALLVRSAVAVGICGFALTGCATGFNAPTRHAIANLQAASASVTPDLQVNGLIVALSNGSTAEPGGVAYIEFTATNTSDQSDELQSASATAVPLASINAPSSGSASPTASSIAGQSLPASSTTIPAKTAAAPGSARIVVALNPLTQSLRQGEVVQVSLRFAKGGSVSDIDVPVQGSDYVGSSFLPSSPPAVSGSASPSPASS